MLNHGNCIVYHANSVQFSSVVKFNELIMHYIKSFAHKFKPLAASLYHRGDGGLSALPADTRPTLPAHLPAQSALRQAISIL